MRYAVARGGEVITSAAAVVIVALLALLLASFGGFGSLGPGLAIATGRGAGEQHASCPPAEPVSVSIKRTAGL